MSKAKKKKSQKKAKEATVKVKVKKLHKNAKKPEYKTDGAVGFDLYALNDKPVTIQPGKREEIRIGLAMEIPQGCGMIIWPRSGLAINDSISPFSGLIDSDFRGEITVFLFNYSQEDFIIHKGDRVAQGLLLKFVRAKFEFSDNLSKTKRGKKGFGSTGA